MFQILSDISILNYYISRDDNCHLLNLYNRIVESDDHLIPEDEIE